MGTYDEVDARLKHYNDVVDGKTECDCEVTDSFEHNGKVYTSVKFSPECVNPQIGIDALLD